MWEMTKEMLLARIRAGEYDAPPGSTPPERMALQAAFANDLRQSLDMVSLSEGAWSRLFDMAWDQGHASGFREVVNVADDLALLLGAAPTSRARITVEVRNPEGVVISSEVWNVATGDTVRVNVEEANRAVVHRV